MIQYSHDSKSFNFKDFILGIILVFVLTTLSVNATEGQTTPVRGIHDKTPDLKAFTNACLVITPDNIVEKGTLVIKDGLIVAAGPDVTIPEGAFIIDLSGYTIYPGFIDPFSDYGIRSKGRRDPRPPGG